MKNISPTYSAAWHLSRVLLSCFGLIALSFVLAGCGRAAPIKIGLVAPFEGRDRALGYEAIYAARLAVREINAAGGVGGRRVSLVTLDDGGDSELAYDAAASLAIDPELIAIVGHGLPETTVIGNDIYREMGLPLVALGTRPFLAQEPVTLPAEFLEALETVTPFDETAGPFSGATYDAFNLVFKALAIAESNGYISRESVAVALEQLAYEGLTNPAQLEP